MSPPEQRPFDEEELRRTESELDRDAEKTQQRQRQADEEEIQRIEDETEE
jgi:hypothetical protein